RLDEGTGRTMHVRRAFTELLRINRPQLVTLVVLVALTGTVFAPVAWLPSARSASPPVTRDTDTQAAATTTSHKDKPAATAAPKATEARGGAPRASAAKSSATSAPAPTAARAGGTTAPTAQAKASPAAAASATARPQGAVASVTPSGKLADKQVTPLARSAE